MGNRISITAGVAFLLLAVGATLGFLAWRANYPIGSNPRTYLIIGAIIAALVALLTLPFILLSRRPIGFLFYTPHIVLSLAATVLLTIGYIQGNNTMALIAAILVGLGVFALILASFFHRSIIVQRTVLVSTGPQLVQSPYTPRVVQSPYGAQVIRNFI